MKMNTIALIGASIIFISLVVIATYDTINPQIDMYWYSFTIGIIWAIWIMIWVGYKWHKEGNTKP